VAILYQGIKSAFDQPNEAATQYGLLAEYVANGFVAECGPEQIAGGTPYSGCVSPGNFSGIS
jgi:hypothetical protein